LNQASIKIPKEQGQQ